VFIIHHGKFKLEALLSNCVYLMSNGWLVLLDGSEAKAHA